MKIEFEVGAILCSMVLELKKLASPTLQVETVAYGFCLRQEEVLLASSGPQQDLAQPLVDYPVSC